MPYKSTYPDITIPDVDVWGLLFERPDREFPDDKVIFTDAFTNRCYTFTSLRDTAQAFGRGLLAAWHWQRGDVLAFYTPNCVDTPAVTWGTLWAGGIVTTANPAYTTAELAFQLKDSGAQALVTQLPHLTIAREAAQLAGIPPSRIILLGDDRDATGTYQHFTDVQTSDATPLERRTCREPKKDLAYLVYSSGTTGHPKGVMLSHRNIVSNICQLKQTEGEHLSWTGGADGRGDRILAFLPFYHIYGLNCLLHQSVYSGVQCVVMPHFDIETLCRTIQDFRITFAYVVPPVVLQLAKHPVVDRYNLSSLRMMNCGAAPLTREIVEAVHARINVPVKQGYGLSETSPTTHTQRWVDWHAKIGSAGRLLPNQVAKFVSEEGQEVSRGEVGELWLKGPNVFLGYLNNDAGTRNALTDDGYFKTGDVGYEDADGNLFITDRLKELIKYKGFQVPPAELEGLLASHPHVDDAAVIGIYQAEQATEIPLAFIVVKPGVARSAAVEREIVSWVAARVAPHKRLRGGVRFVDSVPKSPSGKILRRLLRQQAAGGKQIPAKL